MQTPINKAIEALREQAQQFADLKLFSKFEAVSDTCNYLESLLPAEQQFAKDCYNAAIEYERHQVLSNDFTTFFQQFNGEKK